MEDICLTQRWMVQEHDAAEEPEQPSQHANVKPSRSVVQVSTPPKHETTANRPRLSPEVPSQAAADHKEADREWAALTTWLRMNLHHVGHLPILPHMHIQISCISTAEARSQSPVDETLSRGSKISEWTTYHYGSKQASFLCSTEAAIYSDPRICNSTNVHTLHVMSDCSRKGH